MYLITNSFVGRQAVGGSYSSAINEKICQSARLPVLNLLTKL